VAGLFAGEEQAKVEVLWSTRCIDSRPDDTVARPRLAGLGNSQLRPTGLGAEDGEARRGEAAVVGCGPAVASSGGQSSWRKEEERERNASSRERQRREGEGEWRGSEWRGQGAGPGLKHGEVAARAAQTSHAARAACMVMILFINFKFPILPQTYH
jgi:hypothetical protein